MIQDIINNITTAELEAENIVKIASQHAKEMKLNAEVECEKLKKQASVDNKDAVKLKQNNAEVAANKKTEIRIREGQKQADEFIKNCQPNTEKAVDFIVGRLIEKYGNN